MTNGPVATSMIIYDDLLNYHSGIYHHTEGDIIGAHAVLLVGWGETIVNDELVKYWEV